ncbi:CBS domain-containing protein [Streptomyces pseudovenezuelae]|uniref:hypothetical protein n=1 Tax=Streptomyces pseudovenezuelae TaxID=67350 RepID=UPI0036E38297
MSALELTGTYPPVSSEDDAAEAVQLLFEHKLPALLVADRDGQPYAIVPGSQPMERLVPEYALDDPILVAVIDDRHLNKVPGGLAGRAVAEWQSRRRFRPPTAGPDTSVIHITALKSRTHTLPVAVVERDGGHTRQAGAVPAARLTQRLVGGT